MVKALGYDVLALQDRIGVCTYCSPWKVLGGVEFRGTHQDWRRPGGGWAVPAPDTRTPDAAARRAAARRAAARGVRAESSISVCAGSSWAGAGGRAAAATASDCAKLPFASDFGFGLA